MSAKSAIARKPHLDIMRMRRVMAYNIRRYRKIHNLSQGELASLIGCGIGQKQISGIELARLYIDAVLLLAICRALGVTVNDLLVQPDDLSLLPAPEGRRALNEKNIRLPAAETKR